MTLPIESVLPELVEALRKSTRALLVAPPGAGKTTRVAPALLGEVWCTGEVLLLVPRRLAARAAAEFMARERGETPGQTIGYATRLDSKVGKATRVVAMTHGVFLARIQADPELAGVSAVLFDEVHERSLDNDLALALALDAASALRPDLRLLAMSATLDVDRFQKAPWQPADDRQRRQELPARHPLCRPRRDRADRAADGVGNPRRFGRTSWFAARLPARRCRDRAHRGCARPDFLRTSNFTSSTAASNLPPSAKRSPPPQPGKRKLVLASSIAETSVTIEDVRIVIDSGLARRPRYDRGAGLTRLVTERASRAAVTQRAGRAARQAPGVAIRLWEEAANASLPAHDPPEIFEADLSSLLLTCLLWGEADPSRLPFLDPPPAAALEEAGKRLTALGAIDPQGRLTDHGRAIAALPVEPRLAHMLLDSAARGFAAAAADVAVLLSERGLGGNEVDLELRWRRWRSDKSSRAEAARKLASNWRRRLRVNHSFAEGDLGRSLALAFPDRVSRRRDQSGETWQSVGGRGFRLDPTSALAGSQWLAIGEVAGHASGARILSATAICEDDVLDLFADRIETRHDGDFDPATGSVTPTRSRRLGAIRLSSGPDPHPDPLAIEQALIDGVRQHGSGLLRWDDHGRQLLHRATFARRFDPTIPGMSEEHLLDRAEEWLPQIVSGKRRLGEIPPEALNAVLEQLIGYEHMESVKRLAPMEFASPAGSLHRIDYSAPAGPTVEVRAQALFGLARHPTVAGGQVPLVLAITSPAGRPIQTTRDLPRFWAGSWRDVAKDMRGRYPKHAWPDDPAAAAPTLRTKRAS